MAIVTKVLGEFNGGLVRFEYDYDNNDLRVRAFRCVNNSTEAAYGQITRTSDGASHDLRFAPGTTQINIPTAPNQRVQLTLRPDGKLDGAELHLAWPYP